MKAMIAWWLKKPCWGDASFEASLLEIELQNYLRNLDSCWNHIFHATNSIFMYPLPYVVFSLAYPLNLTEKGAKFLLFHNLKMFLNKNKNRYAQLLWS